METIRDINSLPSIKSVMRVSQGLALLDAIIMPDWEYRYFSFNGRWSNDSVEKMASMRDGSGSEYFIHFSKSGAVGKVLSPEEWLNNSAKGLRAIPECFSEFKSEAAFNLKYASFFFWREFNNPSWQISPNDKHSLALLDFIVNGFEAYHSWAEEYYERIIDKQVAEEVFNSLSTLESQLLILNPELSLKELEDDLCEIIG